MKPIPTPGRALLAWGLVMLVTTACSPQEQNRAADTAAVAVDTAAAAGAHDMAGMSMTGDPDRDFLRMMSDHHKGLIAMAHETMEMARGTAESRADARKLDTRQDGELEQLIKLLEAAYQDRYEPKVMPQDQAKVDSLLKETGAAYATRFYRLAVGHHREAIAMIDQYLPRSRRAEVKAMAEQMRRHQLAEIEEFERKAGP